MKTRHRIAITGIGAITPIGTGVEGLWDGVRRGDSAVRRITRFDPSDFPSQIAAEVAFDPLDHAAETRPPPDQFSSSRWSPPKWR